MFKGFKDILSNNNEEEPVEQVPQQPVQEVEEYYMPSASNMEITLEDLEQFEQKSQYETMAESLEVPDASSEIQAHIDVQVKNTKRGLFDVPTCLQDLKINQSLLEDLLLKTLFFEGRSSGIELSHHLRVPMSTILNPILTELADSEFIEIVKSMGMGGHNKMYNLTEKGKNRTVDAIKSASYVGPVPVHIDDYTQAVSEYPTIEVPSFEQFAEFYKDMVVEKDFLERLAVALSSGQCLFLYGSPGMGKTTFIKRFINCVPTTIRVPFSVYINGSVTQFFDRELHEPVDKNFSLGNPIDRFDEDKRWVEIKRPCILVGTEFSARNGTNIQYNPDGNSSTFPVTTKSNGGMFVIDDFGRQPEPPDQILNMWIGKLEGAQDVLSLSSGQQFYVPYQTLTVFTTNLEPESLLDDAFLRRLTYKLQIPDISLENYCYVFANEADKQGMQWDDMILEYLIDTYYTKQNRKLAGDQPRGIIQRAKHFCTYMQLPKKLTPEIIDKAWSAHFLKLD